MATSKKIENKPAKIEHVVCSAIATDDGYFKGQIIKTGQKFQFSGVTKDGKLPLWLKATGKIKVVKDPKIAAEEKKRKELEEQAQEEAELSDLV